MQFIDLKFKDNDPKATVEKIRGILASVGVEVTEQWNDSGLDHCHSLMVCANNGIPSANGKGVTRDFARASAYGEFIERMQAGLFFYKFQSINGQKCMNLHTFAPDVKYMTIAELVENGEWMDPIIEAYGPGITRESIAEHCRAYACTEEDSLLTVPYYSLFEDKYVYLPAGFVEHMYTTNGCCAGNSREEAWVHALSEIMERYCTLRILTSGKPAPKIPDSVLNRFSVVSKILEDIRKTGEYDVDIFDYSLDNGFPVISTRIISKKTHSYRVNVAADPVLEIAIQRTLTEIFQGSNMDNVTKMHEGRILSKVSDFPLASNVINQLESGNGFFTADFFADELTCTREASTFQDNSGMNNKELLSYMLDIYRKMGKQVYVRNLSYLGFNSYKFVVPGFSETRSVLLDEIIPEYAIADEAAKVLRNASAASDEDLAWMLHHSNIVVGRIGRYKHFNRLSGIPLATRLNSLLTGVTRSYAAYRLKQYEAAATYLHGSLASKYLSEDEKEYLTCVIKYLRLKKEGIEEEKIRSILYKFFMEKYADQLYEKLDNHKTPYDDFLISCDFNSCEKCRYAQCCSYQGVKEMVGKVGEVYHQFVNGQASEEFKI